MVMPAQALLADAESRSEATQLESLAIAASRGTIPDAFRATAGEVETADGSDISVSQHNTALSQIPRDFTVAGLAKSGRQLFVVTTHQSGRDRLVVLRRAILSDPGSTDFALEAVGAAAVRVSETGIARSIAIGPDGEKLADDLIPVMVEACNCEWWTVAGIAAGLACLALGPGGAPCATAAGVAAGAAGEICSRQCGQQGDVSITPNPANGYEYYVPGKDCGTRFTVTYPSKYPDYLEIQFYARDSVAGTEVKQASGRRATFYTPGFYCCSSTDHRLTPAEATLRDGFGKIVAFGNGSVRRHNHGC